jgi:hypothetical protein
MNSSSGKTSISNSRKARRARFIRDRTVANSNPFIRRSHSSLRLGCDVVIHARDFAMITTIGRRKREVRGDLNQAD